MQPVKTTALRANEAARNLNAGNNGEVGSMVTFRTGIGLKRVWSQRRNGCHPRNAGFVAGVRRPLLSCLQVLSSPLHPLLICASRVPRLVDRALFLCRNPMCRVTCALC